MHIEKIQQNNAPRVPELIMQALVKAIEDGHIRVGEDMPSERDLAEMLGVGRGSLRECLAILEFLGAIDSRGNRKCCCGTRTIFRRPAPGRVLQ